MDIQNLIPLINTVMLLVIFFYQKNKNKILVDRIAQQEKILSETKGIILHQSTAIDSQSKVVDTAIKYSESFSVEKLEMLIRKEISLEQKEEQGKIKNALESKVRAKDERIEKLELASQKVMDIASRTISDLLFPTMGALVKVLIILPDELKNKILNDIDDGSAKEMLVSILTDVEKQMAEKISNKTNKLTK
ncbi:hypothetical protein [Celerinatantimonas diazotrophica]|uniref:Uncharacterized protein n=1 Tax=Celerinatantimonas diazotrophica TaxID=412034 RepID=A0A4R1J865_9GAMM|nr:hypothetical protein [Celerinatantimonas diazotrophica]TCK46696.1 hypothetical protein EV690_3282 [Celerinatantimonas diazotrophica]CAG9295398.1 hypothetical protein CEDIAZO_00514 [Celerinatantimonas diazotrophica]